MKTTLMCILVQTSSVSYHSHADEFDVFVSDFYRDEHTKK